MMAQQIDTQDVVKAMTTALSSIAARGKLPGSGPTGVAVLYHKQEAGRLMFHFVTEDDLEVKLDFDMLELAKQGRAYIDSRMEIIITNLRDAREERRRRRLDVVLPTVHAPSAVNSDGLGLRNAIHDAVKRGACH